MDPGSTYEQQPLYTMEQQQQQQQQLVNIIYIVVIVVVIVVVVVRFIVAQWDFYLPLQKFPLKITHQTYFHRFKESSAIQTHQKNKAHFNWILCVCVCVSQNPRKEEGKKKQKKRNK